MRAAPIAAIGIALALSACCSMSSADATPAKDQHQIVDLCVAAKTSSDYVDFRSILEKVDIKDVPRCSPLIEGEYYIRVIRSTADGSYRVGVQYWVTALIIQRADNGPKELGKPVQSGGKVLNGEEENQTAHRLIMGKWMNFEVLINETMRGRL